MTRLHALILCAGLGTRLRPLTNTLPKPLIKIANLPLLEIIVKQLVALKQVEKIHLNLHYRAEQIAQFAKELALTVDIPITSHFEETILGSGGAIANIASQLGKADLLTINGDILSDFAIEQLIEAHTRKNSTITMGLLRPWVKEKTKIWCHRQELIKAIGQTKSHKDTDGPYSYSCIQVLSNSFVKSLPAQCAFEIIPYYKAYMAKGQRINATIQSPFWHDIGDLKALNRAKDELSTYLRTYKPEQKSLAKILAPKEQSKSLLK